MNPSHDFEEQIFECDCGAWWLGEVGASGTTKTQIQECPRCGEEVESKENENQPAAGS